MRMTFARGLAAPALALAAGLPIGLLAACDKAPEAEHRVAMTDVIDAVPIEEPARPPLALANTAPAPVQEARVDKPSGETAAPGPAAERALDPAPVKVAAVAAAAPDAPVAAAAKSATDGPAASDEAAAP